MQKFVLLCAMLAVSSIIPAWAQRPAVHAFVVGQGQFLLDGKPFQIRAGEMHYSRVPRPLWRDRLHKMKAMGLNAVSTYMFWNMHEPEIGAFDFQGNQDVAEFVKDAQEEGLYVLLRPGPYACAEWEWGGYPYWLANFKGLQVRSRDPQFTVAVGRYLREVGRRLKPLQISRGGPILMVQVENEYGSYGSDKDYLGFIRDVLRSSFDVPLYTVDGPSDSMLQGGTLPDVFMAVNFGSDPESAFKQMEKFRPGQARMCGEFYPGWFDQWGQGHVTVPMEGTLKDFEWMMSQGISFNMYMVHGGWTPGFMNGANVDAGNYHPQTNSYYDDTCIDDAGRLTPKFEAYRKVMEKYLPADQFAPIPAAAPTLQIPETAFTECAPLLENLPRPITSAKPLTFEELHQPYGYVLYEATLPAVGSKLELRNLQDRARDLNSNVVMNRMTKSSEGAMKGDRLSLLVENLGRVNYGSQIPTERKGISGGVFVDGVEVAGEGVWKNFSLPMTDLRGVRFSSVMKPGPAWYRASFELKEVGDTFLDMRKLGKGVVWVNGHDLGRYWRIGAQQTTYVPGCWLRKGKNEVVIFEEEKIDKPSFAGVPNPIWEGTSEG